MDIIKLRNEIYCRRDMLIRYFVRKGMRDEAEDMAGRTMIKAVESVAGLQDEDKLENWLMRIAVNERNLRLREMAQEEERMRPHFARMESGEEIDLVEEAAAEKTLEEVFQSIERSRNVTRLLYTLPPLERAIFLMRAYEGRKYREIAEDLKININTAKSIYSRSRRKLLKNYKEIFGEEARHECAGIFGKRVRHE